MAQEEQKYIFTLVGQTIGLEKAKKDAQNFVRDLQKTQKDASRIILGAGGQPAYLSKPGFSRNAEELAYSRSIQTPKIIPASAIGAGRRSYASSTTPTTIEDPMSNWPTSKINENIVNLDILKGRLEKIKEGYVNAASAQEEETKVLNKNKKVTEDVGKSKKDLSTRMKELGLRALEVIPIWLALRAAYMSIINAVQSGMKHIIDFDREMARIKNVMDLSTIATEDLQNSMRELSKTLGLPIAEVANAFYKFADAGLSAEVSLAGMNSALKASVAMFADAEQTAKTLADVYVMMGNRITQVSSAQDKMDYIMSSIAVLQKTNKFELNEYTQGLKNWASSAQAANITLDQMLFLLAKTHTYMQRGSTGGSQLTRVFLAMEKNMDKVSLALGRTIDPSTTNRYELFKEVLEKLNKDFEAGGDIFSKTAGIFEIRGKKAVDAIAVELKAYNKEEKEFFSSSFQDRMKVMIQQTENATKIIERQKAIFVELRNQMFESYVSGVTGAANLAEALERVNIMLNKIKDSALVLGAILPAMLGAIFGGLPGVIVGGLATISALLIAGLNKETDDIARASDKLFQAIEGKLTAGATLRIKQAIEAGTLDTGALSKKTALKEIDKRLAEKYENPNVVNLGEVKVTQNKEQIKTLGDISKMYEYQEIMLERLNAYGYTEIEIQKKNLRLMIQSGVYAADGNEIFQQRLKILSLCTAEVNKLSDTLKGSVEESLTSMLKGDTGVKDFAASISKTYTDTFYSQVAGGLTNRLFKTTGIGEMFGSNMSSIKNILSGSERKEGGLIGGIKGSFDYGADLTCNSIIKGFQIGSNSATVASSTSAGWNGSASASGSNLGFLGRLFGGGRTGSTANLWDNTTATVAPANYYKRSSSSSGLGGGIGGFLSSPALGWVGAIAGLVLSRGGGENAINYKNSLTRTLTLGGNRYVNIGNPIVRQWGEERGLNKTDQKKAQFIWNVFDPGGGITSFAYNMKKHKRDEQGTPETTTQEISSRIDITNKNLQLINRNLMALKNSVETYILPTSAYFSEKRSNTVEDNWSLMGNRGLLG